ncbi:uncharacterized protein LOC126911031 [Spodoptera frugiperda]|uniref:Uncharacterized protein LOC126911031 n=1 Tax=Spodoptera frugiperda TaxID=7108 RepID=A0A9R0DS12_SPOFR|nr:uncharacterized protein LOC126911031 [Spodoptera frugiperda]
MRFGPTTLHWTVVPPRPRVFDVRWSYSHTKRAMGSRSKKILSMVPIPDNNLKKNNTFVENWLANCHPEDQDNDHDSKLESSRFSVNNITSTSCEAKNELSATDRSTVCDNAVDTVIQEVNADLILLNTVTENVTSKDIENAVITTDSKTFNLSDDEEIVSSNVVIADVVPETTLAKSMLRPDTVSNEMNSDNNEDFSASDGSEYEPPQKRHKKKFFSQFVEHPVLAVIPLPLAVVLPAQVPDHLALAVVPSTLNLHLAPNILLMCQLYIIMQLLRIFNQALNKQVL